ncbi:MAG: ATP-binding protein [Promethearchaeota archaeon]
MKRIVEHRIYGKGIVLRERYGGEQLYVKFQDDIERWVNFKNVSFSSREFNNNGKIDPISGDINSQLFETTVVNNITEKNHPYKRFISRLIIESLRMGIFPEKFVREFTFGRDDELNFIKDWLNESNEGALIISGEYGIGKTHLLDFLKSKLVEEYWAISMIQFDSVSLPLNKPKIIYENMINNFKYKNGNFKDFLEELVSSERVSLIENHNYLNVMINRIRNRTDHNSCWLWIKGKLHNTGSQIGLPPIYTYATAANIFCYILSGIGYALKEVLNYKGLVLLFDEAENIDPYWYTSYQREKGWNFLKGLILMANNSDFLLNENINQIISKNEITIEHWGEKSELQYYYRRPLRYLYAIPCGIKLIFAFTYNKALFNMNLFKNLKKFRLESLDKDALEKIALKISELYKLAYNLKNLIPLNFSFLNETLNLDSVRMYIKGVVEYLDLKRFNSKK